MNYEETQQKRFDLIEELRLAEEALYQARRIMLPQKDNQFNSELARKVEMEARTALEQAKVDAMQRELEVLADRANYLITKG